MVAAGMVDSKQVDVAFNISGGLHHASAGHASGFCVFNDPALAIKYLLEQGLRVAYLDIDAHHGDGVQEAFFDNGRVLPISIHGSGQYPFPATGFVRDSGGGVGGTVERRVCRCRRDVVACVLRLDSPAAMVYHSGISLGSGSHESQLPHERTVGKDTHPL